MKTSDENSKLPAVSEELQDICSVFVDAKNVRRWFSARGVEPQVRVLYLCHKI